MLNEIMSEEVAAQEQNVTGPDVGQSLPKSVEEGEKKPLTRAQLTERWLEVISTILLAVVAVATAWSGYQSARWSGVQADNYVLASGTRVESDKASTQGGQERLYDVMLFNNWLNAYTNHQAELTSIYEHRFRDEFRPAFAAWIATDPFNNSAAPAGPLFMSEYHIAANDKADALEQDAQGYIEVARTANQRSDNYVLVTVFLAVVLFFVAIAQRFNWPVIQIAVLSVALAMLLLGIYNLATFPIQ